MQKETFVVQSQFDDLKLHGVIIRPEKPKAIIQILHGMCEYKERYEDFMRFFAERGYLVVCHDHRGHGDSVLREEDRGYLYDFSGQAIVEDAALVTRYVKETYPNLPVYLFGHSMGSMIARCYIQKHDTLVDKVVICGSPSKNPFVDVAILLTKTIRLFRGERYKSKMLAYLSTGKGNERFKEEGPSNWLSRNRENIEKFITNPKGKVHFSVNGYENLFKLMRDTYRKKGYRVQNPDLPIFFVSGSDDAVLVTEEKWRNSVEDMKRVGYQDVSCKLYPKLRHEIFSDIGGEEVMEDLLEFFNR
jgi:alpha-beta hydrolase superfamily lysophospholipase